MFCRATGSARLCAQPTGIGAALERRSIDLCQAGKQRTWSPGPDAVGLLLVDHPAHHGLPVRNKLRPIAGLPRSRSSCRGCRPNAPA